MKATQEESVQDFSSKYLEALLGKPESTSLSFPTIAEAVPFDQLYVTQTVTEEKREEKQEQRQSENQATSSDQDLHHMAMGSMVRQVEVDLWQKLRQDHRIVVTAPAWTGKSTLCKWVVQQCHGRMHWLPIYVPFRSLSQSSHATLLSYLEQDYLSWLGLGDVTVEQPQPDNSSSTFSLGRWLYDQWQSGQALLILDGADEEFDRTKREVVLSALPTTGTRMTRPRVLLTSRPGGEAGALGFEKIELQEFTRKKIETLIRNCGVLLNAQDKIHKLLREMKEDSQTRAWRFAGRPGHLIQMVVTYVQEGVLLGWEEDQMDRIATRRFQITSRVTPKLEPDDPFLKRQLTEELAFHSLFCRKGQTQTRAQMLDLLTQIIGAKKQTDDGGYRPQQASRLLNDLCANSGYLKPTRQNRVDWESVPWLQFFAASHLAQKLESDTGNPQFQHWAYSPPNEKNPITLHCPICHIALPQFAHYLWREEWQKVIVLVGACLPDATNLLNRILQEPEDFFSSIIRLYYAVLWRVHNCSRVQFERAYHKLKTAPFVTSKEINNKHLEYLGTLGAPYNGEVLNQVFVNACYRTLRDSKKSAWRGAVAVKALGKIGGSEAMRALLPTLQDLSEEMRGQTAQALGEIRRPETVPALVAALQDSSTRVVGWAAEALGKIGGPEAMRALLPTLQDLSEEMRGVLKELGEIRWQGAVPTLVAMLQSDPSSQVKNWVAEALGRIGGPEAFQALMTALNDSNHEVRWAAINGLGKLGGPDAVDTLVAALRNPSPYIRYAAVDALVEIGSPETMRALIATLEDPKLDVGCKPVRTLVNFGGSSPESVRALVAALQNFNPGVGAEAAKALGNIGGPDAMHPLVATLQNSDEYEPLREIAAKALGKIGGPEAVRALVTTLQNSDVVDYVRRSAAEALGEIGGPEAMRALMATLVNTNQDLLRIATAKALENLGKPEGVKTLIAILQNSDVADWLRESAAEALGEIGGPRAVRALVETIQDPTPDGPRESAVKALGKIGGPEVVQTLVMVLEDPNENVWWQAGMALANIGRPEELQTLVGFIKDTNRYPTTWKRNGLIHFLHKASIKGNFRIFPDGRVEPLP